MREVEEIPHPAGAALIEARIASEGDVQAGGDGLCDPCAGQGGDELS